MLILIVPFTLGSIKKFLFDICPIALITDSMSASTKFKKTLSSATDTPVMGASSAKARLLLPSIQISIISKCNFLICIAYAI